MMNFINGGASSSSIDVKKEAHEKPETAAQPVAALPTEKVQPLTIRYLSPRAMERSMTVADKTSFNNLTPVQQLCYLCQRIVSLANQKLQEDQCQEDELYTLVVQKDNVGYGFGFLYYARQVKSISKLAHSLLELGGDQEKLQTSQLDTIGFLYRQYVHPASKKSFEDIFSLSSGDAWHRTSPFADYAFPHDILVRVLDSKVHFIAYQPLVGNTLRNEKTFKEGETLPPTRIFDKFVTQLHARIRTHSSLYNLTALRTETGKYPQTNNQIVIEMGAIRFQKKLALADYPSLLDHLAKIYHGDKTSLVTVDANQNILEQQGEEEKDSDELAFWKFLTPVSFEEVAGLDQLMDTAIWNAFQGNYLTPLHFSHKRVNDYMKSSEFRLVSNRIPNNKTADAKWDSRKSAQEMLKLIEQLIPDLTKCQNATDFAKILKEITFEFKAAGKTNSCSLRDMFGGEVRITNTQKTYFLLGNIWLSLSPDYLRWVEKEFRNLITKSLIKPNSPHRLATPWPTQADIAKAVLEDKGLYAEDVYNRSYQNQKNYLVGDRVLVERIELFDLIQYIPDSQELLLYHVKEGFGQKTRDAASQIRVSLELLNEYLSSSNPKQETIVDKLCTALENRYPGCLALVGGKAVVINAFKREKITYVYAVYNESTGRSLQNESNVKEHLEDKDFDDIIKKIQGTTIVKSLEAQGFLKDGLLTDRFRATTQDSFKKAMANKEPSKLSLTQATTLHRHIHAIAVSPFDSLIARIELLKLCKQVEKKGMKFAICEIPKPVDAPAAAANEAIDEESQSAVIASQDIPLVAANAQLADGSIFEYDGQSYRIERTQADGACGLHALLGTKNDQTGIFHVPNAQQSRNKFAQDLVQIIQTVNNPPPLQVQIKEKFHAIAVDLLLGLDANGPNGRALVTRSQIVTKQDKIKSKALEIKGQKAQEKVIKACCETFKKMQKNNAKKMEALVNVLAPGKEKADIPGQIVAFMNDNHALKKAFQDHIDEVSKFQFDKTYNQPLSCIEEKKDIDLQKDELKNKVYENQNTLTDYAECIISPNYWFLTNELCLAGLVCKISVRIFSQTPTGELIIADEIVVPEATTMVNIFHHGNHFSRITPLNN